MEKYRMKRDFALRLSSRLDGIRSSLGSAIDLMQFHVPVGNITEEECLRYLHQLADAMLETIRISEELFEMFPDIKPEELTSNTPLEKWHRTPRPKSRTKQPI